MAENIRMSMAKQRQYTIRVSNKDFPTGLPIDINYNGEVFKIPEDQEYTTCEGVVKLLQDAWYHKPDPTQKNRRPDEPQRWVKHRRYNVEIVEKHPMPHEKKKESELVEATA
jgi:hypothetical protein